MYVVLENHLTSLCDTPKAYEGQPGFEVLRTVPGTWDEIRVPLARMNEHVTVARRSGSDWWVGSLNNGTERNLKLKLTSLVRRLPGNDLYRCGGCGPESKQSGQTGAESYKEGYH